VQRKMYMQIWIMQTIQIEKINMKPSGGVYSTKN
jgi:hypothetical protein